MPAQARWNFRVFVILSGLIVCLGGCQTASTHEEAKKQAEQRWSRVRGQVKRQLARQQFDRGQFAEAAKTLQESTSLDPASAEAFALLAKANLELGKPTTAEQVIRTAMTAGLECADFHYFLGVILEQRDDAKAALTEYEKARQLDGSKVAYLIAQVETMVSLGEVREALALVDQNAQAFDDQVSLAILGARIAALQGDVEGSLTRLAHPDVQPASSLVATVELGLMLAQRGRCLEALRVLEPVFAGAEPYPVSGVRRELAECFLAEGEGGRAYEVISPVGATAGIDRASAVTLAKAALQAGEYMLALQAVAEARRANADSVELELLLSMVHRKRGDLMTARQVLEQLLQRRPDDVDGWCLLGEVLGDLGETQGSREAFERALNLDPECGWATARTRP